MGLANLYTGQVAFSTALSHNVKRTCVAQQDLQRVLKMMAQTGHAAGRMGCTPNWDGWINHLAVIHTTHLVNLLLL